MNLDQDTLDALGYGDHFGYCLEESMFLRQTKYTTQAAVRADFKGMGRKPGRPGKPTLSPFMLAKLRKQAAKVARAARPKTSRKAILACIPKRIKVYDKATHTWRTQ